MKTFEQKSKEWRRRKYAKSIRTHLHGVGQYCQTSSLLCEEMSKTDDNLTGEHSLYRRNTHDDAITSHSHLSLPRLFFCSSFLYDTTDNLNLWTASDAIKGEDPETATWTAPADTTLLPE